MSLAGETKTAAYHARDIAGRYAFRFSGFNNANPHPFYIVGMGTFDLRSTSSTLGEITGKQNFAKMLFTGMSPKTETGGYDIRGEYTLNPDGVGSATVTFRNDKNHLIGQYKLIIAGTPDRFWLISDGIKQIGTDNSILEHAEVTNIEAIRMTGGSG